jgi:hypothetical protein
MAKPKIFLGPVLRRLASDLPRLCRIVYDVEARVRILENHKNHKPKPKPLSPPAPELGDYSDDDGWLG